MKILLTNDDGFDANGIIILEKVLSANHEVYIIAPDSQRSGSSNAITVREPLTLKQYGERHYTLSGYPTDCVNVGLKTQIVPDVDCVVSGINQGPNLGDDVFFSGTVGAARMGYIFGRTGFAVSLNTMDINSSYYEDAAAFLLSFIEKNFDKNNVQLFNINYPNIPKEEVLGERYAKLARRHYMDSFSYHKLDGGKISLTLDTAPPVHTDPDTDADYIKRGYVTITPLTRDCCDYDSFNSNTKR